MRKRKREIEKDNRIEGGWIAEEGRDGKRGEQRKQEIQLQRAKTTVVSRDREGRGSAWRQAGIVNCGKGGVEAGLAAGREAGSDRQAGRGMGFPVVTARGAWRPRGIMAEGKTLIRVITGSKLVPFSANHFTLKSMLF